MRAVFDANVVASAVCWNGEPFLCLVEMARRHVFAFGTDVTFEETSDVTARLIAERAPKRSATGRLKWYLEKLRIVGPAPLGKRMSRDPKDDPYLAAAFGAKAGCIVTFDKDLLVLNKPFGVSIVTPSQFLKILETRFNG